MLQSHDMGPERLRILEYRAIDIGRTARPFATRHQDHWRTRAIGVLGLYIVTLCENSFVRSLEMIHPLLECPVLDIRKGSRRTPHGPDHQPDRRDETATHRKPS